MENRIMDKGIVRYKRGYVASEELMERAFEGFHHANDTGYVDNRDLCNQGSRDCRDSKYNRKDTYNEDDMYKKMRHIIQMELSKRRGQAVLLKV